ncbi:MAG TPA: hypothetical protein VFA26_17915 [Gemmataceae bacterium]|nr:hypothetical protein [Gemmataceae bacterium]
MAGSFQFPNLCARCGHAEPTTVWTLQSVHSAHGSAATVHTFQYLDLPVCASCRKSMSVGLWVTLALSAMAGVAAFFPSRELLAAQGLPAPWIGVAIAAFVGLVVFTGCFFILKPFTAREFAKLPPGGGTVVFDNPEYQRQFDALNAPVPRYRA